MSPLQDLCVPQVCSGSRPSLNVEPAVLFCIFYLLICLGLCPSVGGPMQPRRRWPLPTPSNSWAGCIGKIWTRGLGEGLHPSISMPELKLVKDPCETVRVERLIVMRRWCQCKASRPLGLSWHQEPSLGLSGLEDTKPADPHKEEKAVS